MSPTKTRSRRAPISSTVLVLTNEDDTTAGMVIEALAQRGVALAQVDTGDFPQRWTVTGRIGSTGVWRGGLAGPDVEVDLESVTAVYYRRPSRYRMDAGLSPADRRFVEAEAHHGVGGMLSCLPCRWVSHPGRIADASAKPAQLRLAAACGLRVPETLISSSPDQVRAFVAELDAPVVYKPMSPGALRTPGAPRAVYATLLDPATIDAWLDADAIGVTANQFQRYIADKDADLRVTAVGERLFPVAIRARTPAARVDWRADYGSLDYEVVEVPDDVAAGLRAYLKAAGLAFAAFDLVATTAGEHYFLEANPNGEWGWLTDVADVPIAAALADLLLGGESS
ncbi:MAG: ATP-grasp ribosomal peptide maturase [Pseudonocardiaceae bacterium]